jgi:ParB-like chromosome segregation protein Spo0J
MVKKSNRADNAPRKEIKMYDPKMLVIIGYDTDDGPSHPQYDQESNNTPLLEADIKFTMKHGVIQPISCKRDGDRLLVVFGRGRTRQLREANNRLIADGGKPWLMPVQIVTGDETKMLALKHGENSHRREINPMARAREALELSQKMTEQDAADTLGLGVHQFRNVLKLNNLAPAAAKALIKGDVPETGLYKMADMSEADQTAKIAEILADTANKGGKKPTVRDVEAKVREASGKAPLETPAQRIKRALDQLDKLDDSSTKDEMWAVIKKVQKALSSEKRT